jgi:hypothetical protein
MPFLASPTWILLLSAIRWILFYELDRQVQGANPDRKQ